MKSTFKLETLSTVLCIGAHCDDIEIGCGGTLHRLVQANPQVHVVWAVFAGEPDREPESRRAASQILAAAKPPDLRFFSFRGSYFPTQLEPIKDAFETLKKIPRPDLILTHRLEDRHQDHALLAQLTWNTFRSHTILEYEIPKYEGDLGHPNIFVGLTTEDVERKCQMLMACFPSQHSRSWFTPDTFRGLARIRGIESGAPHGYAEAFHARKLLL